MEGSRQSPRRFGLVVGGVFAALAVFLLIRSGGASLFGRVFAGVGGALLLLALVAPPLLRPVQRAWMALALVLGWINTRLLLGVVFYTLFTLARIVMLLLRKDPMHRRPDRRIDSYWIPVENGEASKESLEHSF